MVQTSKFTEAVDQLVEPVASSELAVLLSEDPAPASSKTGVLHPPLKAHHFSLGVFNGFLKQRRDRLRLLLFLLRLLLLFFVRHRLQLMK